MKKCTNCGAENQDSRRWCRNCMKELPDAPMHETGKILPEAKESETRKSRLNGSMGKTVYGRPEEHTAGDKTQSPVSGFASSGNQKADTETECREPKKESNPSTGSRLISSMRKSGYDAENKKVEGDKNPSQPQTGEAVSDNPVEPDVPNRPYDSPVPPPPRKKFNWNVFAIASASVAAAAVLIAGAYFGWNALSDAFKNNASESGAVVSIPTAAPEKGSHSGTNNAAGNSQNDAYDTTANAAENTQTSTNEITTQLTKAIQSFSDGSYIEYTLSYNRAGQLASVVSFHSSTGKENTTQFSYNASGQLTQVQQEASNWQYNYDSNGQLSSWSSSGNTNFVCEYNEKNQLIAEWSTSAGDDSYHAEYAYDNSGRLKSKTLVSSYGDMEWTETSTYSHNTKGQLTEEVIVSDWGNGTYKKTRKYSYTYAPLVIIETFENNVQLDTEFALDGVDEDFFLLYINGCDTSDFETKDGCLTKVNSELYTYEFFYNGETGETYDNSSAYRDELTGKYTASYENVKITITATNASAYYLSYSASGITLENIPLAYFEENTSSMKRLMFILDDYYPDHCGYVEVMWAKNGSSLYSYNALIDGVEDTEGYYSDLIKK